MLRQNRNKKAMINRVYYSGEKLPFYSAKTVFTISFLQLSKTKTFAVDKTTYLKLSREKLMPLIQPSRHSNAKSLCVIYQTSEKNTMSVFVVWRGTFVVNQSRHVITSQQVSICST